jgi:peptidoglycan/LPS O-acetylase OafA/YrhL
VLILAIGIGIGTLEPASADFSRANEFSGLTFLANLVGLQTVVVKNFGANYALWSLANETWYYVLFPLLLLVLSGRGMPRAVSAVAIALIAAWLPLAITLYFVVWLLGAVFSRIRIDCSNGVRIVLLILSACASIYYRLRGSNADLVVESFFQDLVCCLPFLALLSTMHFNIDQQSPRLRPLGRIAHFFADFSFTLYVIHVPTIFLLRHLGMELFGRSRLSPSAPVDYLIYVGMLALILVVAYLSYLLFESHTFRIRRIVKRALLQRQPKRSGVAAVSTK